MELNITDFFNNAVPSDYSASNAEMGNKSAGAYTWRSAQEACSTWLLLDTTKKRQAFKEHIDGFGAWEPEEVVHWSNTELNALCIQMISGDMRDYSDDTSTWDWAKYESMCEEGNCSGSLYRGDDNQVYYYLGL